MSISWQQALKGKKWSGYKLVAGRSQRKWIDPDEVEKILKSKRFRKMDYTQTKLLGIPAIEKISRQICFPGGAWRTSSIPSR